MASWLMRPAVVLGLAVAAGLGVMVAQAHDPIAGAGTAEVDNHPWTAASLTISPLALGGVRIGMTLAQAQAAGGLTFQGARDGYRYPLRQAAGVHPYVGIGPAGFVRCVGAALDGPAPVGARPAPVGADTASGVHTAAGVRLGDTVAVLRAAYGRLARYVPPPAGGGVTDHAGYVVSTGVGELAFALNRDGTAIVAIAGGLAPMTPTSCTG